MLNRLPEQEGSSPGTEALPESEPVFLGNVYDNPYNPELVKYKVIHETGHGIEFSNEAFHPPTERYPGGQPAPGRVAIYVERKNEKVVKKLVKEIRKDEKFEALNQVAGDYLSLPNRETLMRVFPEISARVLSLYYHQQAAKWAQHVDDLFKEPETELRKEELILRDIKFTQEIQREANGAAQAAGVFAEPLTEEEVGQILHGVCKRLIEKNPDLAPRPDIF